MNMVTVGDQRQVVDVLIVQNQGIPCNEIDSLPIFS